MAFKKAHDTEDKNIIAEILGYDSVQAIYKVISEKLELNYERLIRFRESTKCSIDWLITGEGTETVSGGMEGDLDRFDLEERDHLFIRKLATHEHKPVDQVINELLNEALRIRSSKMFAHYERLTPEMLEELLDIAFVEKENGEQKNTHLNQV
jgi:hypothetical protein